MKIVSVVGARPQFVRPAPIPMAAAAASVEHVIVHTGQHSDPMLSDMLFDDLGIAARALRLAFSPHLGEETAPRYLRTPDDFR